MKYLFLKIKQYLWQEKWNIAVFRGSVENLLEGKVTAKEMNWLFSDYKNGFCADPFLFEWEGKNFLFFEEFENNKQKGRISFVELLEDEQGDLSISEIKVLIDEEFHISYPFVFSYDGEAYMIPETSQNREIALYRAVNFPNHWEKERVLVPDFAGIDATLYYSHNRWWIFCSNDDTGCNESLYIFYADDLFGEWKSHDRNPLKFDISSSRSAGSLFVLDQSLIRPAQNCKGTYGKEIVLNEIETLTTAVFEERATSVVSANSKLEYSEGMHTVSFSEKFVAIDAKKFIGLRKYFDPWNSKRKEFKAKIMRKYFKKYT